MELQTFEVTVVATEIDKVLDKIKDNEVSLASSYARLGNLLYRVRKEKFWSSWGFESFGDYIDSIKERIRIGRTQLYMYVSVSEKLLPSVSEEELVEMGVSKAIELQRIVVQTGNQPSREMVERALNPQTTREDIKAEVFQCLNIKDTEKPGKYFDLGGCYLTDDERKEVAAACAAAELVDPPVSPDLPVHARKKEVLLRFAREFSSSYPEMLPEEK